MNDALATTMDTVSHAPPPPPPPPPVNTSGITPTPSTNVASSPPPRLDTRPLYPP